MTTSRPTIPLVTFGASGLLAGELLRLVEGHSTLRAAGAATRAVADLGTMQPHLTSRPPVVTVDDGVAQVVSLAGAGTVAVALALPHGESARLWTELRRRLGALASNIVLVDLAADYRLADPALYRRAYGAPHEDEGELDQFVYGLPEHHRSRLREARRAAAPGCFATAMQLATLPAAAAGLVGAARPWILSAVTGSSGSGNTPSAGTHHPHRHGNLWAYALDGHRHEAELRQALRPLALDPSLCFVPHSGPFVRGIHMSAFLPLATGTGTADTEAVRACYREAYENEPFVEVLDRGVPDLRRVVGSNRASLAVHVRGDVLTVLLTLDNVIKGGAGQALQCLNLMLGFDETDGLPRAGLGVS